MTVTNTYLSSAQFMFLYTVIESINRQVGHVAYHVGQIVLIAKMLLNEDWKTLSIPKEKSKEFNTGKFLKK